MGSGADSANNFFGLCGGKNKLHMLRRFFYELEQRIKALWGDHMCFIENKDFVAITSWSKHSAFAEISGVINTIVARCINLDDIEGASSIA